MELQLRLDRYQAYWKRSKFALNGGPLKLWLRLVISNGELEYRRLWCVLAILFLDPKTLEKNIHSVLQCIVLHNQALRLDSKINPSRPGSE
jgi:hypothetical protein